GFSVARDLRAAKNYIPLLMLTARGRPEDVLHGFESGADDYLPKPFNLDILIARIKGLLRRKSWSQNVNDVNDVRDKNDADAVPAQSSSTPDAFTFAGKTVDFRKLQLQSGKQVFQLTLMETELLRYLIRNSGHPVSRKAILEEVWDLHEDTDTRAIDNFIVRLRRYIEQEPSKPRHLLTVRGLGYQFVPEPEG
ncbi:MAG TPA: response regulator transcription factor, partial [Candidatus Solibacter sp.]|nr:response regulator transcription factor [Candidatus Solibacter sp.]